MKGSVCFVLMLSSFLAATAAWGAGGWISSGGESLIYARNPWFVKNTTQVNYCLKMDEPSFSISRAEVLNLISDSFLYWKNEFQKSGVRTQSSPGYAVIASQDFRLIEKCDDETPLIFKLGKKTLSNKEIRYLKDPKKFIGVTIRKDYDLVTLRGSGVIYISADKGADAYTNNGHMISEAWRSPTLFRYALMHELGHLFGIAHMGSGLMGEVFMMVLLNKDMSKEFEKSPQLRFLNPQDELEICNKGGSFNPDFFQIPKNTSCLRMVALSGRDYKWEISRKDEATGQYVAFGIAEARSLEQPYYALRPAATVQVPPEQEVFSALEMVMGPFLVGGFFSDTSFHGVFRPNGSVRSFPLQMSLSAEKITFVGTVNNIQQTVLSYYPISFMRAIFP